MPIPIFAYTGAPPVGEFEGLLERYARIAIAGGPRTGKTTLANRIDDRERIHTDQFRELAWEDQPQAVLDRCAPFERFVVEGVQVARALRKGLAVDLVIWLRTALVETTPRQQGMAKGVRTVLDTWISTGAGAPALNDGKPQ